jgi:ABC-type lipoprotein export system ATPase subunit
MRVRLEQCTVRFGIRIVLDRLSLELTGPGCVAIMGPSGCGKTTLLSVIAGDLSPSAGSVTVDGLEPARTRHDWIVQSSPLLTRRTALENVLLGPLSLGVAKSEAMDIATAAMRELAIEGLMAQRVFRLSGGERQRLSVARAMASHSPLILADEPTASLDPVARTLVCDGLERASAGGALVAVATHDPYVAERADQVLVLEEGHFEEPS